MTLPPLSGLFARAEAIRRSAWLERHLDQALAALVLVCGAIWVASGTKVEGAPELNLLIVAGLACAMLFRRRSPLGFTAASMALAIVCCAWLSDITQTAWTNYLLLIPAYTVASYEQLPRALVGLALAEAAPWGVDALSRHSHLGDFVFTTIIVGISWVTGRALRSRRLLQIELIDKAKRLTAEREDRARLAVADERTRIARELHAVVANNVSAMVIQAEAAKRTVGVDADAADRAMIAIEQTGREALSEMRRILGVLRRPEGDRAALAPQPGVGQIHALLEQARTRGRHVELQIDGDPGPLPFAVDLAAYRILEEVLAAQCEPECRLAVILRFAERSIELEISGDGSGFAGLPTIGMNERIASCDGRLQIEDAPHGGVRMVAVLPRAFEEAFA
ncbi:MAG: sensor histidine kinase [Solirubrobacteraceae bacterium]